MEIDKLKREYENFLECIADLATFLEEFLSYARQISEECDIKYIEKLNYNLPFIEKYINALMEMYEEAKNISFDTYNIPDEKFHNNVIIFPLYEDEDIYVDMNYPLQVKWQKEDE